MLIACSEVKILKKKKERYFYGYGTIISGKSGKPDFYFQKSYLRSRMRYRCQTCTNINHSGCKKILSVLLVAFVRFQF